MQFPDIWLDLKQTVHSGLRPKGFPVLLYHALAKDERDICGNQRERKFWVSADSLRQQLECLRQFQVKRLEDLWMPLPGAVDPSKKLAITFDDGHLTDYELAFPALHHAGATATFFVNTATIMMNGFLNWSLIAEMQRHGMSFQSHGHDHLNVTELSDSGIWTQLSDSKACLEDHLGCAVRFFAAPFGEVSERVLKIALDVGYQAVCTTRSWPVWPGDALINRICIHQFTSSDDVRRLVGLDPMVFLSRMLRSAILYVPRRVFPRRFLLRQPQLDTEVPYE